MKNYKLTKDISCVDFLEKINSNRKVTLRCCNCNYMNGNCIDFAKKGTCKAYNYYKRTNVDNSI